MTLEKAIAIRILELCSTRGISLNKLSTMSGITQSTLNNIVNGTSKYPRLSTLKRISEGLDITLSELLDTDYINNSLID